MKQVQRPFTAGTPAEGYLEALTQVDGVLTLVQEQTYFPPSWYKHREEVRAMLGHIKRSLVLPSSMDRSSEIASNLHTAEFTGTKSPLISDMLALTFEELASSNFVGKLKDKLEPSVNVYIDLEAFRNGRSWLTDLLKGIQAPAPASESGDEESEDSDGEGDSDSTEQSDSDSESQDSEEDESGVDSGEDSEGEGDSEGDEQDTDEDGTGQGDQSYEDEDDLADESPGSSGGDDSNEDESDEGESGELGGGEPEEKDEFDELDLEELEKGQTGQQSLESEFDLGEDDSEDTSSDSSSQQQSQSQPSKQQQSSQEDTDEEDTDLDESEGESTADSESSEDDSEDELGEDESEEETDDDEFEQPEDEEPEESEPNIEPNHDTEEQDEGEESVEDSKYSEPYEPDKTTPEEESIMQALEALDRMAEEARKTNANALGSTRCGREGDLVLRTTFEVENLTAIVRRIWSTDFTMRRRPSKKVPDTLAHRYGYGFETAKLICIDVSGSVSKADMVVEMKLASALSQARRVSLVPISEIAGKERTLKEFEEAARHDGIESTGGTDYEESVKQALENHKGAVSTVVIVGDMENWDWPNHRGVEIIYLRPKLINGKISTDARVARNGESFENARVVSL